MKQSDKYLRTPYYCGFEYHPNERVYKWYAVIWRYDGAINGCHQPFVVVDILAGASDVDRGILVETCYPGIDYAPVPEVIDGMLLP